MGEIRETYIKAIRRKSERAHQIADAKAQLLEQDGRYWKLYCIGWFLIAITCAVLALFMLGVIAGNQFGAIAAITTIGYCIAATWIEEKAAQSIPRAPRPAPVVPRWEAKRIAWQIGAIVLAIGMVTATIYAAQVNSDIAEAEQQYNDAGFIILYVGFMLYDLNETLESFKGNCTNASLCENITALQQEIQFLMYAALAEARAQENATKPGEWP